MSWRKKVALGVIATILAVVGYSGCRFGPALWDAWQAGLFEKTRQRSYAGSSADNLKALHTALMLYHESEGQFPHASGWMDAVLPRIQTGDMKKEEALKKLIHPSFLPAKGGRFGYAMNEMASAKYKDDLPNPHELPLIFDSSDTSWNAHGDPAKLLPVPTRPRGNLAISVDGTIVKL